MAGIHNMLAAGTAPTFQYTISTNNTNFNLRTGAINAGWDGSTKVVATINAGVYLSSNSTATAALTISGSFPAGLEVINNGFIIGMGGAGGGSSAFSLGPGVAGSSGGLALLVQIPVTILNSGTIGGGGGGGGSSGSTYNGDAKSPAGYFSGGGGGGRSGASANSAGGVSYGGTGNGGVGSVSVAGAGGLGPAYNGGSPPQPQGGAGGGWGNSGSTGSTATYVGAAGGAGGAAVSGNANITWLATGTRLGAIT